MRRVSGKPAQTPSQKPAPGKLGPLRMADPDANIRKGFQTAANAFARLTRELQNERAERNRLENDCDELQKRNRRQAQRFKRMREAFIAITECEDLDTAIRIAREAVK